jgi:hypothetical protein
MFTILDPVRMSKTLDSVEKLMNRELFQRLDCELVSPNMQIYSSIEADEAAGDFPTSIASAWRLPNTTAKLNRKYYIPSLDRLLEHKRELIIRDHGSCMQNGSKLGHSKHRRIFRKELLKCGEKKTANCEVIPQAI